VVNEVPPADRDIAMVFQTYALYPHMTVRENLAFALRLRKRPAAEIAERVKIAATTLGLTAMLDRTPRQLSGGQRQRVAIGRAIVREPRVFLFDEPLSNLDAALRSEMRREIAALHRSLGATMLYVTHDQVEAMTLGDRIVVMNEGRVRQVDTPANVYDYPHDTFVAGFLGSPPMNLLRGTVVQEGERRLVQLAGAPAVKIPLPDRLSQLVADSREVILGVRPEHLKARPMGGTAGAGDGFPATLELAEPLGHEHLLHLSVGDATLTARSEPASWPPMGSTLFIRPATDHLHLFDAATGVSLTVRQ
jgi:multiple sugar transport system ATP-binding protein